MPRAYEDKRENLRYIDRCNRFLEQEQSIYRFFEGKIIPIPSKTEIQEINRALCDSSVPELVKTHIRTALERLSDREKPDFRNSIKESISAVECVCRQITGKPMTLTAALDQLAKEGKIRIPPSLKKGLESLYGYTGSEDGIRHAPSEESELDAADARLMLVLCVAFTN